MGSLWKTRACFINFSGRNPEAGEIEESAVGGEQLLMADQQAAELTEPGIGSLHNPAANVACLRPSS